jgi:hypothetical protein
MRQGMTHEDAVRLAKEKLGDTTPQELAAYIQEAFGLKIKPPIVTVLLGTFQERAALDKTGQAAYAKIERWRAENPAEAKKMAAVTKRREAARRRKAEAATKEADGENRS